MRRLVIVIFLLVFSVAGFAQKNSKPYTLSVLYNQDKWAEFTNKVTHSQDTLWHINFRYTEHQDTIFHLKLVFPLAQLPAGYDQIRIDWGNGLVENLAFFNDTAKAGREYHVGKFPLKITLSSTGVATQDYEHFVFNKSLSGRVELSGRNGICREKRQQADTFLLRLVGHEDNPPLRYMLYDTYLNPDVDWSEKDSVKVTVINPRPAGAGDSAYIIVKKPLGSFRLWAGYRLSCQDLNTSPYFLSTLVQNQVPIKLYERPNLKDVFSFADTIERPMHICTQSDLFQAVDMDTEERNIYMSFDENQENMYKDEYSLPVLDGLEQYQILVHRKDSLTDPVWKITVDPDHFIIAENSFLFNEGGYYKLRITAENRCGADTLWTDSVSNSSYKRLLRVYEGSNLSLLNCLTEKQCINTPGIVFTDNAKRLADESLPEYSFNIKRGDLTLKKDEDYNFQVKSVRLDSAVVTLELNTDSIGLYLIEFCRSNKYCGLISRNFQVTVGKRPEVFLDTLGKHLVQNYGFALKEDVYVGCDTFRYVLPDLSKAIRSNLFSVDSVAFYLTRGSRIDTLLYGGSDPGFLFDSTECTGKIQISAHNYCGWKTYESYKEIDKYRLNLFVHERPQVSLLRDGLTLQDTICAGIQYKYELQGGNAESQLDSMRADKDIELGNYGIVQAGKTVPLAANPFMMKYNTLGLTGQTFIIANKNNPGCKQYIYDSVYIAQAPDQMAYRDSILYCESVPSFVGKLLFDKDNPLFNWAEWHWKGDDGKGKGLFIDQTFSLQSKGVGRKDTLVLTTFQHKGCFLKDSIVFIPRMAPAFSLLDGADTCVMKEQVEYSLERPLTWFGTKPQGTRMDLYKDVYDAAHNIPYMPGVSLSIDAHFADSVKIIYHIYNALADTTFGTCGRLDTFALQVFKPLIRINKKDTLQTTGGWTYFFSRMEGKLPDGRNFIDTTDLDIATLKWIRNGIEITGGNYVVAGEERNLDSLVFKLEGRSLCGQHLEDSLIVYIPRAKIEGFRAKICSDTRNYSLWGEGKAQGHFIDPNTLKWKIINTPVAGKDWGTLLPAFDGVGEGETVNYTPGAGIMPDDTVRIEVTGNHISNSGVGIDTIFLQVNPRLEYYVYKDTLITKNREVNIRHIAPEFLTIKNYSYLFISQINGIGELVGDSICRFDATDYPITGSLLNYNGNIRIGIQGLEGCGARYTPKFEIEDPVKVIIRPQKQLQVCNGDSTALKSLLTVVGGEDRYTHYSWQELGGVTGRFNSDSSYYVFSTDQEQVSLEAEAYKVYTAYTGEKVSPDMLSSTARPGIKINARPEITMHSQPTLCQGGEAFDLSGAVDIVNGTAIKWEIFENGIWKETVPSCLPGEVPGVKSFRVSAMSGNICPDSVINMDIPILAAPEIQFSVKDVLRCQGGDIHFEPVASASGVVAYAWNFGDGAVSADTNVAHVYDQEGVFPVELTVTYGSGSAACSRSWGQDVTVFAKPVADFTPADREQVPENTVITFTGLSSGAVVDSWRWTFGLEAPYIGTRQETHSFTIAPSDVSVKLAVTTLEGCQDSVTHVLKVVKAPVADFSIDYDKCSGVVNFNTAGIVVNDASVHWDFGDGRTLQNAMPSSPFVYETYRDTTYRVILTLENAAATARDTQYIELVSRLEAGLEVLPANGCNKIDKEIRNITRGNADWLEVQWGDGSAPQHWADVVPVGKLSHRYINETTAIKTYKILLIANNECKTDTAAADVKVLPLTVGASIEVDPDLKYKDECFGQERGFINHSYGFNASGYRCDWIFEDGVTVRNNSINVSHIFEKAGDYWVKMRVGDNCNELTDSVLVNVRGNDDLRFTTSGKFCERQPVGFEQVATSGKAFSVLKWGFSDNSHMSGSKGEHSFEVGEHKIWLYGESENCPVFSDTLTITVQQAPQPLYTLNGGNTNEGCRPFKVDFAGRDAKNLNSVAYWDFKDNATSGNMNETYSFEKAGDYDVTFRLTASNGCRDSVIIPVRVLPSPVVGFEVNDTLFCTDNGNFEVELINTSRDVSLNNFEWSKGGERFSIFPDPGVITFNNTFGRVDFQLKATNKESHCISVLTRTIRASQKVAADFSVTPSEGCEGTPVIFRDKTGTNAIEMSWEMGDGVIMTGRDFEYIYDRPGEYTIRLKAKNGDGCEDFEEQIYTVHALPIADFSWQKDNAVSGFPDSLNLPLVDAGGIRFENHSFFSSQDPADQLSYHWVFGDSFFSAEKNPVHRFPNNGNYEVMLVAKTAHGCADSIIDHINIDAVKGLFIPNAFTPGTGDERMALFQPKGVGLFRYQIRVYGPGGVCVWSSDKLIDGRPAEAWDGIFKGELLPKGVYLWEVNAVFIDGSVWSGMNGKTGGALTLIR